MDSIVCLYTDVLTFLEDIWEDIHKHVYSGRLWVGGILGLFHFVVLIFLICLQRIAFTMIVSLQKHRPYHVQITVEDKRK